MDDDDHDANRTRAIQHAQKPGSGLRPHRRGQRLAEDQGHGPVGGTVANQEKANKRVRRDLADRKTWFVCDGGTLAATVTIAEQAIPDVWKGGDCDLSERSRLRARLVTARDYAGRGLGAQLIDWAGSAARSANGAEWIRIDVWTDNMGCTSTTRWQWLRTLRVLLRPRLPVGCAVPEVRDRHRGPRHPARARKPRPTSRWLPSLPAMAWRSSREASSIPARSRPGLDK